MNATFFTKGYVFLIDDKDKIRWRGCGQSKESELNNLYRCTDNLLDEMRKCEVIDRKKPR